MRTTDPAAKTQALERRRRVLRIFQDMEWGNVELLDGWDGEDLAELRFVLGEDDYERLVYELEAPARER